MTEGQLATAAGGILTCNFIWKNTSQNNKNMHSPNYKGNPTSNSAGINSLHDRQTYFYDLTGSQIFFSLASVEVIYKQNRGCSDIHVI